MLRSLLWLLSGCVHSVPPAAPMPADCFATITATLSDDAYEGRGAGSAGLEASAEHIAGWFRAAGLTPGGQGGFQPFGITTAVESGPGNRLDALTPGTDWAPFGFSSSGAFSGDLVLVGYGLVAEPLGYDDYAGIDVTGKVVLALRYEPGADDPDSPFDGRRASRWSDLRYKALKAREAGATALILVDPSDDGGLPGLRADGTESDAGLPVVQVSRAVADGWLGAIGTSVAGVVAAIDASGQPASRPIDGVRVDGAVDLVPVRAEVRNVIGVWPGAGALADEIVVVGAHYDHLGLGGEGSLAPDVTEIHNGADDNASGVAAMICGVDRLALDGPRRTLVAIAFTAEERGLLGSSWYVQNPLFPLDRTVAMVNLDMVGRVREGRIAALGAETSPAWAGWLAEAGAAAGLTVDGGGDGYGPSDQTSFYARGIPVVHLFTGAHAEYHTPADDADTLNLAGGEQVVQLLASLLGSALTDPARPQLIAVQAPPPTGDVRGSSAWLGTVPDYSAMGAESGGVLLSGVREGGPAHEAGIRGGDRIVGMGGITIHNLYDMTYVLQDHRPGDAIEVVVERDGARVTVTATLGTRRAQPAPGDPHGGAWAPKAGTDASHLLDPREVHLADLRQLTNGGENAEAYWSPDGRSLIFQRTPAEGGCDQQFTLDLDSGAVTPVSSGAGRTTCGYFAWPHGDKTLYATTEAASAACPPPPDRSRGYVWPLYEYDIVWDEAGVRTPFLPHPGYDAEATVCMTDGRVLFTSTRDGDLDLYVANADGTGLRRLTDTPGYDGGAFFTPDCSEIVWRASRPEGEALAEYRALLADGLVRPSQLEIFLMDADGTDVRQLTHNGAANFGPYPLPDASGVLFASNVGDSPREFDLHLVSRDGGALERITFAEQFDGFPMFSPDGRYLVFGSNRGGTDGSTNLFLARWVP